MRVLGILVALIVGLALWGYPLAFIVGAATRGEDVSYDGAVFFLPVVAFALPLAVLAFRRGFPVVGLWVLAVAPVLGVLDFVLVTSIMRRSRAAWERGYTLSTMVMLLAVWLACLGAVLAALALLKRAGGGVALRAGSRASATRARVASRVMPVLRIVGFVGALVVAIILWGLSLALSEGGGPFARARGPDLVLFWIPIVCVAIPLALMAFQRERVTTGVWILATAPLLGALDFALVVFAMTVEPLAWEGPGSIPTLVVLTVFWLLVLGLVLLVKRVMQGSRPGAPGRKARPDGRRADEPGRARSGPPGAA